MKKQICLNQDDIQQIIADSFCVDKEKVILEFYKDIEGFGTSERYIARIKATIEVPMNDGR